MRDRKGVSKRVDALIDGVAKKAFRTQGFAESAIVTKWRNIVGELLAENSLPVQLRFPSGKKSGATLRIMAEGAFATEIQHMTPIILERINVYFGYAAVAKLQIIHGALPTQYGKKNRQHIPDKLPAKEEREIAEIIKEVKDEKLRQGLAKLGRSIYSSHRKKTEK